jgi:hypothetical protein
VASNSGLLTAAQHWRIASSERVGGKKMKPSTKKNLNGILNHDEKKYTWSGFQFLHPFSSCCSD